MFKSIGNYIMSLGDRFITENPINDSDNKSNNSEPVCRCEPVTLSDLYLGVIQNHNHFSKYTLKLMLRLYGDVKYRDWIVEYYMDNDHSNNTGISAILIRNVNTDEYKLFNLIQYTNADGNSEVLFNEAQWNPSVLAKWLTKYTNEKDIKMQNLIKILTNIASDTNNEKYLVTAVFIDSVLNYCIRLTNNGEHKFISDKIDEIPQIA